MGQPARREDCAGLRRGLGLEVDAEQVGDELAVEVLVPVLE
jgi:hypothetical protein